MNPYESLQVTKDAYVGYAQAIGTVKNPAYNKIAIGASCMEPSKNFYTPLNGVISLCKYEPSPENKKLGIMLYALSYDVTSHGSGYPDGTFTNTIHTNLP